jgi:hypothetical protein
MPFREEIVEREVEQRRRKHEEAQRRIERCCQEAEARHREGEERCREAEKRWWQTEARWRAAHSGIVNLPALEVGWWCSTVPVPPLIAHTVVDSLPSEVLACDLANSGAQD